MAYIDYAYVTAHIDEETYAYLFALPDGSGVDTAAQLELLTTASGMVDSKLELAGFVVPLAAPYPEVVQRATFGVWLPLAYARRGLEVPVAYAGALEAAEKIGTGDLPVPGQTPAARDAVGGVSFSSSSSDTTTGKPQIFSSDALRRGEW